MTKIAGSASESGSISQRHGSADPDPDPHQNVMDPEHWLLGCFCSAVVVVEPDPNLVGWFRFRIQEGQVGLQKKEEREIFSCLKSWMFISWRLEASPEAWTFGSDQCAKVMASASVTDPDPGSDAFLTLGSGIRNRFFLDLGSRIPNPYF